MLTDEQQEHLASILEYIGEVMAAKYTAGAIEHGGNIWDMTVDQLEHEELNEMIDLLVYRVTKILKKQNTTAK